MKRPLAPIEPVAWRHPLQVNEPAAGFASRLAALNGKTLSRLSRDMKVDVRGLDHGKSSAIVEVAKLGNVDPAPLMRVTPRRLENGRFEINGQMLERLSLTRTYLCFCPHCVARDVSEFEGPMPARPWLRLEWMVSHFRQCDVHGVPLERVTPQRRPFEPCDFNDGLSALLAGLPRDLPTPLPPSPFQKWLRDRLTTSVAAGGWLDEPPLYASIAFCETLGVSSLQPSKVPTSRLTVDDWRKAADEGYTIAASGPDGVKSLLQRLNEGQRGTRGVWGPRDTYGVVYGMLQRTVQDPGYAVFRQLVGQFAIDTMPIEPGTDVLGLSVRTRQVHTVRTAATDTGVHPGTFKRWAARSGVAIDDSAREMDHRITLQGANVAALVDALKGSLTTPQVIRKTGISRLYMDEIIAAGHIETVSRSNGIPDAKHRFTEAAVSDLMARFFDGAENLSQASAGQVNLVRARHVSRCTIAQALDAVFGGKLKWKGRLPGGRFDDLLVDADEFVRLIRDSLPPAPGYTKSEVAEMIAGLPDMNVEKFVAAGLLEAIEAFHPEAQRVMRLVSMASVARFTKEYVMLGELSSTYGLHYKTIKSRLEKASVDTVREPRAVGCYSYPRLEAHRALGLGGAVTNEFERDMQAF